MGFLWRRRSSLVKIVILLSAVWFTIAFLIYSEDRRSSGLSNNIPLPLIKDEFDGFRDISKDINRIDEKETKFFGVETSKANIENAISPIKNNRLIAGADDGKCELKCNKLIFLVSFFFISQFLVVKM